MDLSIKSMKENWNKKSTAQKVGTVAAGVAATAAVATVATAGILGGKGLKKLELGKLQGDEFTNAVKEAGLKLNKDGDKVTFGSKVKFVFKEGFGKIGEGIKAGWNKFTGLFKKKEAEAEAPKEQPAALQGGIDEVVGDAQ